MKCYGCGGDGHIERDCLNAAIDASGKPPWCGICDELTRTIDQGDIVAKCQACHPNRHKLRHPLRRCPSCHVVIYEWDHGLCGSHLVPGVAA